MELLLASMEIKNTFNACIIYLEWLFPIFLASFYFITYNNEINYKIIFISLFCLAGHVSDV